MIRVRCCYIILANARFCCLKQNPNYCVSVVKRMLLLSQYITRLLAAKLTSISPNSILRGHPQGHEMSLPHLIRGVYGEGKYELKRCTIKLAPLPS